MRVLLNLGCINVKILCAHLQEEILTIPKYLLNLMDLEPCYGHVKKIKVFQNWFDIQFRKAVFMQLRFLLFSQPIIIRKMTSGGVLELPGSPLDYGHRDFENWCRNGREN